jgi:hypothetical protein
MIRALTILIVIVGFVACHEIKSGAPPSSAWSFK